MKWNDSDTVILGEFEMKWRRNIDSMSMSMSIRIEATTNQNENENQYQYDNERNYNGHWMLGR
jgi:hypothetical protein